MGSLHFRVMTITNRRMPCGRTISVLSLAVWLAKFEKNDKVRHNMTQIASFLAVATVLLTYGLHFTVREGGLYARHKYMYLCRNLSYKMQGGLCARGGA